MDSGSNCLDILFEQNFGPLKKHNKRYTSVVLSREMHGLCIGQGLTLSPIENYQVFLWIFFNAV